MAACKTPTGCPPPLPARARTEAPALADALDALALVLEDHVFKEEARLFPMVVQGGHGMPALLIDDGVLFPRFPRGVVGRRYAP